MWELCLVLEIIYHMFKDLICYMLVFTSLIIISQKFLYVSVTIDEIFIGQVYKYFWYYFCWISHLYLDFFCVVLLEFNINLCVYMWFLDVLHDVRRKKSRFFFYILLKSSRSLIFFVWIRHLVIVFYMYAWYFLMFCMSFVKK